MHKILQALACASALASPAAMAGATGNVGGVSEYMFRGISQGRAAGGDGGAALQGGLDYASDAGFYVGTWGSNIGFAGGTEVDLYGGYTFKLSDAVALDFGAIYYLYTEEDEAPGPFSPDTLEVYAGITSGPLTVKYYYADEANFFGAADPVTGDADEGHYVTAMVSQPLTKTVNVTANLGYYFGDVIEDFLAVPGKDTYIDYSIGLAKTLENGFSASFAYVGTNIDFGGVDDEPKFVIGLKKAFDL